MDLKAASDQNSTADRLTRAGMVICFLATGALLIGTLAFDKLHDGSDVNFSLSSQLSFK
jgi:hypothetical protein